MTILQNDRSASEIQTVNKFLYCFVFVFLYTRIAYIHIIHLNRSCIVGRRIMIAKKISQGQRTTVEGHVTFAKRTEGPTSAANAAFGTNKNIIGARERSINIYYFAFHLVVVLVAPPLLTLFPGLLVGNN